MTGRAWAYLGVALGGAVSIAANVAHSYVPPAHAPAHWRPESGAVGGAVFWPVALFVAIEILARINWPAGTRWVLVRFGGLLPVATVAAVVSYRHLSGLLSWYREDTLTASVGPLAVDGLMVVATAALIATGRRTDTVPAAVPDIRQEPSPVVSLAGGQVPDQPLVTVEPVADQSEQPEPDADDDPVEEPEPVSTRAVTAPVVVRPTRRVSGKPDTAAAVARLRRQKPDITQIEIARRLGVSQRTVSRHWSTTEPSANGNGHRPEITVRALPSEPWPAVTS